MPNMLVYTRSATSPIAKLNVVVSDLSGSTAVAARGTTFTTTVDGVSYNYVVKDDTTIYQLMVYILFLIYLCMKAHLLITNLQ